MLPQVVTVGPLAASSANNICLSQTPAGGGVQSLTINGAAATGGVATLDVARRVGITSAGNDSTNTFVVTGTNVFRNPIQETITGPNATTVTTVSDFLTVTKITISANAVGAITVGTTAVASSPWKVVDLHIAPANFSFGGIATGTVTWRVEYTYDDPNNTLVRTSTTNLISNIGPIGGAFPIVPNVFIHPVLNGIANVNQDSVTNDPIFAWRAVITAGGATPANVVVTMIQAGNGLAAASQR